MTRQQRHVHIEGAETRGGEDLGGDDLRERRYHEYVRTKFCRLSEVDKRRAQAGKRIFRSVEASDAPTHANRRAAGEPQ